jgi:hypothetical protein
MDGEAKTAKEMVDEYYPLAGMGLRHGNRIKTALPFGQSKRARVTYDAGKYPTLESWAICSSITMVFLHRP